MYSRKLLNFPLRHFATRTPILRSARPHQPWQTRTMSLMQRPKTPWRWLSLLVSSAYRPRVLPDYRLDGELPGVDKKDIDIELSDDNVLTIKGRSERESTSEDPDQSWWCSERSVGEFRRSFRFPDSVDREGIDASLKDGVLSITVPKTAESSVSKRIDIKSE
ncbi:hypothetical protein KXV43_000631 [Aspergillus fumigatus]|nr:hypothetical protein KXV43_000631 [Aspergillus fumigatus]